MNEIGDKILKGALEFSDNFRKECERNQHAAAYFVIGAKAVAVNEILKEMEDNNIKIDPDFKKYLKDKAYNYYINSLGVYDKFLSNDSYLKRNK